MSKNKIVENKEMELVNNSVIENAKHEKNNEQEVPLSRNLFDLSNLIDSEIVSVLIKINNFFKVYRSYAMSGGFDTG